MKSQIVVSASIYIDAPVELVWGIATDPLQGPKWNSNIVEVRDFSGFPVGLGSNWTQVIKILGQDATFTATVVECDAPYRGVVQMEGRGNPKLSTTLTPDSSGTRLEQEMEIELEGGLAAVGGRFARPAIERELRETLLRQRALIESHRRLANTDGSPQSGTPKLEIERDSFGQDGGANEART